MAENKIYVQGSYIDIHDNENVYLSVDKAEVRMGQAAAEEAPATLTEDLLGRAVGGVKEYIWGNAAYAVLFCVCRDEYGWQDNASYFERQLQLLGINIPLRLKLPTGGVKPRIDLHLVFLATFVLASLLKRRGGRQDATE